MTDDRNDIDIKLRVPTGLQEILLAIGGALFLTTVFIGAALILQHSGQPYRYIAEHPEQSIPGLSLLLGPLVYFLRLTWRMVTTTQALRVELARQGRNHNLMRDDIAVHDARLTALEVYRATEEARVDERRQLMQFLQAAGPGPHTKGTP